MNFSTPHLLQCPVCKEPLDRPSTSFHCKNNHTFDIAKEGYLNLLLSHQRRSQNPGDDQLMIQARRRFFDSGIFQPISHAIEQIVLRQTPLQLLDCGCGEGSFLGALSGQRIGIDVSKDAIRCAAKRYPDATWIVANAMRELPIADLSIDCILSILAPRNIPEFSRILKPNGLLILGVPGPNHLIELRTLLQTNPRDFEEKADDAVLHTAPQFTELARENKPYTTTLKKNQIADLIQMTPIFWNSSPIAKTKTEELETLPITISLTLITLFPA